jgi:hypothetical protein
MMFNKPTVGQPSADMEPLSSKKQSRSGFLDASKRKGYTPRGAKPLVISNGLLNPNPLAVRNPVPRKSIRALQATFHSLLEQAENPAQDPNEALRSLVLLGTRLLQQAEALKNQAQVSNAKLIVHSPHPDHVEFGNMLSRRADIDLLPSIRNRAQDKNGLQHTTAIWGALLFFSLLYQQPEILTEGVCYFTREGIREGAKDAQDQWVNQLKNLKFDLKSLFAKVQNKSLPTDTLIFSKKDRALMKGVAAAQGFDIKTDAGLQAYTQWVVQLLQETAQAIETVGHPYQLSVMGCGWDAHKGIPKQTECQDVFQRQDYKIKG